MKIKMNMKRVHLLTHVSLSLAAYMLAFSSTLHSGQERGACIVQYRRG